MKKRERFRTAFFLLLTMASLIGCEGYETETVKHLTIESPIEVYTPAMSSVPGLPLTVQWEEAESIPEDIKYHWQTKEGGFLLWSSGTGVVERLEDQAVTLSDSIYWWPDLDGRETEHYAEIKVQAKEVGNDAVVAAGSAEIACRNGFYFISVE